MTTTVPPGSTVIASATGLRKSYGTGDARVRALDGVNCAVHAGELLAITGPSGSGKTTLLHCLSGIAVPDEGQVHVAGVDLASLDDDARADLRRERFGCCFQTRNLLPALTVAENVQLPMLLAGQRAAGIRARTAALLDLVGVGGRDEAYPAQLSGGEQVRVALARALAGDPAVIWADEPTGALDSAAATNILDLFRAIVDDGRTVVVVSHDPAVVATADRILRLRDGRLTS